MKQILFFLLVSILLFSPFVCAAAPETLQVGVASVDVTGTPGPHLGGYLLRPQPSTHVRTRLFARAVYLENKPETLIWIVVDSLGLPQNINAKIKTVLADEFGIEPWRIVLSATHTHSAPDLLDLGNLGWYAGDYAESVLIPNLLKIARDAKASAEACSMVSATGEIDLAIHRTSGKAYVEKRVPAVGFKRADGSFKAVMLGYTMHPVCYCTEAIASEWPGAAADAVRKLFASGTEPFVFQGACGNINPPKKDDVPDEEMQTWGTNIVDSVAQQLKSAEPQKPYFAVRTRHVAMLLDYPDAKGIQEFAASQRKGLTAYPLGLDGCDNWERWAMQYCNDGGPDFRDAEIAAVVLGDRVFVTGPFETFAHMNQELAKRTTIDCFAVGYTNGCYGYLAPDAAYEVGSYELGAHLWYISFRFKRGEFERLADSSVQLIQQALEAAQRRE